ncbi:MAG: hypothetical protein ACI93T_002078, partial [Porticoccaceae bacterium]
MWLSLERSLILSNSCGRSRVQVMALSVKRQNRRLVVEGRFDVNRTPPQLAETRERVASLGQLQRHSLVLMDEKQLASILVVSVDDSNHRPAVICQAVEQLFFDFVELARSDFVVIVRFVVGEHEHLVLLTEFGRQERIDKCDVVVDLADFEDLFAA